MIREDEIIAAQGDGFLWAQRRVIQAAEERGKIRPDAVNLAGCRAGPPCPARRRDPVEQVELTPGLAATLRHAASMSNPVFYARQRMRASTYGIPRFLHSFDETSTVA